MRSTLDVQPSTVDFDSASKVKWMQQNWHQTLIISACYMVVIHYGQQFMAKRTGLSLRPYLVIWNMGLAMFSGLASYHVVPELLEVLEKEGFEVSVCEVGNQYQGNVGYFTYLFILAKLPELFDTAFLVLRKRPISFLHSYHHATVLILSWFNYQHQPAQMRWGASMNLVVHTVMYTYYALRAGGYRVPRSIAMSITTLQILQMIIGSWVSWLAFQSVVLGTNPSCSHNPQAATFQLIIYVSYLVQFVNFFREAYLPSPQKPIKTA